MNTTNELISGSEKTVRAVATEERLAGNVGSGGLRVLATPAVAALMEKAAFELLEEHMPEGITTVGTSISIEHTRASAFGAEIAVTARLVEIDDRKYVFTLSAGDRAGEIAHGTHTRFTVKSARFMEKLAGV